MGREEEKMATIFFFVPSHDAMRASDHNAFLGNCPPTPPLSQHFALREK